jgi:hypothetical protein
MTRPLPHLLLAACLTACAGPSLTDTATTSNSALTAAQCTFQGFSSAVSACFDTFKTCIANSEEATAADCRAALQSCLPTPPQQAHASGGGGMQGGGPGDCGGDGMGGPPVLADGGVPPPPPGGGGRGGPDGHGGPGGRGGPPPPLEDGGRPPPPPLPDPTALTACHDALTTCIAAGTAQDSCFQTEHDCVRAAFQAAFQAACDASSDTSGPCAQGVDGMPPAADGGSQCSGS